MDGKRLIRRLELQSFLSYGSNGIEVDLLPLNVLIGPNGSGKSNVIEALNVLRSTPADLAATIREGGGLAEYRNKRSADEIIWIGADLIDPDPFIGDQPLLYRIALVHTGSQLLVETETIEQKPVELGGGGALEGRKHYQQVGRRAQIWQQSSETGDKGRVRDIPITARDEGQSILAQRRDPDLYPELTWIGKQLGSITIFREWTFGTRAKVRFPEPTDLPTDFLLPDSSNLALVLHEMQQRAPVRQKLLKYLQRFYASAQHIATRINAGTVQLYIDEGLEELVSATRLSDGTLRYLSLLAILLHPTPPPLVCIEEPELGLHPDILPTIGELLIDASQRTQLVVTTHSDALVSALSEVPESIVVCEPGENGSQLRRLDREALSEWLKRYSLGEIWRMGEIGGTRW
ncbi:MAG TPA: AAA family ATPase [Longimicrobium sp.]|nr:AAA family ATPase [Longimicrobium sp.]